jgi:hypothetical protein
MVCDAVYFDGIDVFFYLPVEDHPKLVVIVSFV